MVGILAAESVDDTGVRTLSKALHSAGARAVVIAPRGGMLKGTTAAIEVDKSALTTQSVEYDALVLPAAPGWTRLFMIPMSR